VHGDSTVCASMDIREHPPVRHLTEDYLNDIVKNSQQNLENCDLDDGEEKEDFNVFNMSTQSVILAPFGLSAVLTGSKNENSEQYTEKIVEDWNAFYPMKKHDNDRSTSSSKLPKLVEVISGNYSTQALLPLMFLMLSFLFSFSYFFFLLAAAHVRIFKVVLKCFIHQNMY
jgi:mediator of RNA polymerase II transcription subunit 13